jgi:hypothetical protein
MGSERATGHSPGTWYSDARATDGGRWVNRRRGAEVTTTDPRNDELVEATGAVLRPIVTAGTLRASFKQLPG